MNCACCILSFYILNKYDLLNGLMSVLLISCLWYIVYTGRYTCQMESTRKKFTFSSLVLHTYFVFALIGNRIFMTEVLMKIGLARKFDTYISKNKPVSRFTAIFLIYKCQISAPLITQLPF